MGSLQFGLENRISSENTIIFFIIIYMTENMTKEELLIHMKVKF